jgi:rhamnose utilization protein RhaD (predicted bifunctional aldolase and dehydrogenase)
MKRENKFLMNEFCSVIGRDPLLVQGAGGNVSWKDGSELWIKASGKWLANSLKENIFLPVDFVELRDAIGAENFQILPKALIETDLRPSIETLLHALMPQSVVVHLHAVEILAFLVRADCKESIRHLMPSSLNWALVEYHKPGNDLARAIYSEIKKNPKINILFLKNHGVVVGGNSVGDVECILKDLVSIFNTQPMKLERHNLISHNTPSSIANTYFFIEDSEIQELALNPNIFNDLEKNWALYPDHVVFLGPRPILYESWQDFFSKGIPVDRLPELLFVKGEGVYSLNSFGISKLAQLRCYWDVIARQDKSIALDTLTKQDIDNLINWDAEKHRLNISN